jgi:hypothetical protein
MPNLTSCFSKAVFNSPVTLRFGPVTAAFHSRVLGVIANFVGHIANPSW